MGDLPKFYDPMLGSCAMGSAPKAKHDMTDQLDLDGGKAAIATLETWISDGYAVRFDANGYLVPDDIKAIRTVLSRLRASEAEHQAAETAADEWAARFDEASALATSQAEEIKRLAEALTDMRAAYAFWRGKTVKQHDADLKAEIALQAAALSHTPTGSGEARPDTGSEEQ